MANRTQIVCLHEGRKGRSIDPLFIRALIKKLDPAWIRPWPGNNVIRTVDCGGRTTLIADTPKELKAADEAGGNTTLMVWADLDDDMESPEKLKDEFWAVAKAAGITAEEFGRVVFAFAKDRLENWVEYLNSGVTDESTEGPRVKDAEAVKAARKLAEMCLQGAPIPNIPASLEWSCQNWRALKARMG
ncbi:MAG: hypothetical protein L0Z50_13105 [Verrucomicrobiales bacterium]|nr:hypothetical protein [Verrucomicrobiales bacterium]